MKSLLAILFFCQPSLAAYSYYISHTVVSAKISNGPHTDFPVLIDTTSNDLRTTGYLGFVTNSSGYDIQPASDSACTSFLPFERESYSASTGQVRMHVKVSSLSTSTVIYLCFGDSGVTTDQASPTSVWNSAYKAVYHFGDGATLSLADSTSNANTLTNNATVTAASGQIYGAASFSSASSQYLSRAAAVVTTTPMTFTAWVKSSTTSGVQTIWSIQRTSGGTDFVRLILYQSKVQAQQQDGGGGGLAATSVNYSTSNWFHAAGVFTSNSSRAVYIDGGSSGTNSTASGLTSAAVSQTRLEGLGEYPNGQIDELRISNVARSADWILTEYNSGIPSTFWTVGGTTSLNARRRLLIQ